MRAGPLTTRVRFERRIVTGRDSHNGDVVDWVPYATVWGELVGVSGRQVHAGDEVREPVTLELFIRAGLPVKSLDRCVALNGPLAGDPISIVDVLPTTDPGKLRLQLTQGLRND